MAGSFLYKDGSLEFSLQVTDISARTQQRLQKLFSRAHVAYVGRVAAASPASGSHNFHLREQHRIVGEAVNSSDGG